MNNLQTSPKFLVVLVYETSPGWKCEEPHTYRVSHPEIAYQIAIVAGKEQRYGRKFLGLSRLEETIKSIDPISRSQQGDGTKLVVSKSDLAAFNDPKWQGISYDKKELEQILSEPEFLMELGEIDDIPWHTLSHAYGSAHNVPKDIKRLTSSNTEYRHNALWNLFGSIYHQGTLYSATVESVPFILKILKNNYLPDRGPIAELLESIGESASGDTKEIEEAWGWRIESFGEIYSRPAAEMAAEEIRAFKGVQKCLMDNLELIQKLADDADPDVAKRAKRTIGFLTHKPIVKK